MSPPLSAFSLRLALGAALLTVGLSFSAAAQQADAVSPGLGCGPAETTVGLLLDRVRAETPARPGPATVRRGTDRAGRAEAARPRRPGRAAQPAPQAEEDAPAVVLHAFYTCSASPAAAAGPVEPGWRAVGPLRRA